MRSSGSSKRLKCVVIPSAGACMSRPCTLFISLGRRYPLSPTVTISATCTKLLWPNLADSRDTQDHFHFACQMRRSSGSRRNASRHRLVQGQSTRRKGPTLSRRLSVLVEDRCTRPLQSSGEGWVTFHEGNTTMNWSISLLWDQKMASTNCSNFVRVCPPSKQRRPCVFLSCSPLQIDKCLQNSNHQLAPLPIPKWDLMFAAWFSAWRIGRFEFTGHPAHVETDPQRRCQRSEPPELHPSSPRRCAER